MSTATATSTRSLSPWRRKLLEQATANFSTYLRLIDELGESAYGRHDASGFGETFYLGLLAKADYSKWSDAGLVALVALILEHAPTDEAEAVADEIAEDLDLARYLARHGHFAECVAASRTCPVCLADAAQLDEFKAIVLELDDEHRAKLLAEARAMAGGAA